MADQSPLYDLVLLLSSDAPEQQRAKVLSDVQAAIASAGGEVERQDDWGQRPLAYQIRHKPDADYHLLQFRAPGQLIDELSQTLRITDGVVRFRVVKVRPGTPPAPSSPPPVVAAAQASGPATAAATASVPDGAGGAERPETDGAAAPPADSEDSDSE